MSKRIVNVLFLLSILWIICFTLVPYSMEIGVGHNYNIIPFYKLTDIILHQSLFDSLKNIIGNIILFVPFGFMLLMKYPRVGTVLKATVIGTICSIFIECAQIIYPYRWTDIDDVILNTIGTLIGASLFMAVKMRIKE
ncbi:VanZ family protein [Oceanobacillus sp. J11TS1]|uniref:VanZ family protein n=1 Tax=Oceanobacillus sp. J11TS1 TaxID=2807191 RepID=UPI001B10AD0B|nr:VanZ family protein [Oceanobacillus sp. J11TS1]GIO23448.1 hypothetical protein J11TS1_20290 [Oceanobacillus sp. J11TS1]